MARCKGSVWISIVEDGCYTSHPSAKKLPKSVPPQQRTGMGGREPHVRDAEPQQQQVRGRLGGWGTGGKGEKRLVGGGEEEEEWGVENLCVKLTLFTFYFPVNLFSWILAMFNKRWKFIDHKKCNVCSHRGSWHWYLSSSQGGGGCCSKSWICLWKTGWFFPHLGITFEEIFTCIQAYYVYYDSARSYCMLTTFFMFVLFRCVKRSSLLALVYMYMHLEQVNYNRMDLLMLMCTVVQLICSFRCETQLTKLDWTCWGVPSNSNVSWYPGDPG